MSVVAASAFAQASTDSIESEGIRFGTGASIGAITEKMRITQGGLVGIGYQTPTTPLRVSGTAAMDTALLIPRSVTSAQGGGGNYIASGTTSVSTSNAGTIKFATGDSQRMVIDNSGNVGFGTTTPLALLSVGSGSFADSNSPIQINAAAGNATYFGANKGGTYGALFGYRNNNGGYTGGEVRMVGVEAFRVLTNDNERLRIDSAGNVGIGTTTPGTKLQVQTNNNGLNLIAGFRNMDGTEGGGNATGFGFLNEAAAGSWWKAGIVHERTAGYGIGTLHFLIDSVQDANPVTLSDAKMSITRDGNVGIGTTTPGSYKLYVAGNAWTTGTWGSSDRRWKENVHDLNGGLAAALALHPVTFTWISGTVPAATDRSEQVGLIAQDVEKVMPQLVRTNDDGFKAVAYDKLSVVAIEAIKELKADNDNLRAELNALKKALGK